MWRISAETRAYDWGSRTAIPAFLGAPPTGERVAELWFGTHPLGMSHLDGDDRPLSEVAGDLPFMLKVLAPAEPLSIQVHPSSAMAATGFAAENDAGITLTDSSRDFKDPHPKPEMVYALTRFDTLLGVRPVTEIVELLTPLELPLAKELLERAPAGVYAVVEHLLSEPPAPGVIDEFVVACAERTPSEDVGRGYATVAEAARVHPGDPGVALALLLNRVTLEPGEAVFVGPGLIHAHLSGVCLEVLASSDNVFRAGLTTKRVNAAGVLASLSEVESVSPRVAGVRAGERAQVFAPEFDGSADFALAVVDGSDDLPGSGPRVLMCVDGEVDITAAAGESVHLSRGQAAFASDSDGRLRVEGDGSVAQAYVP